MKKFLVFISVAFIFVSLGLCSDLTYVYKNSLSSNSLENFSVGDTYKDEDGNLMVVSHKRGEIAEFDLVHSKTEPKAGSEISKTFPLSFAGVTANKDKISASFSMTGFFYPVSLMASLDTDFDFSYKNVYFGALVTIPLSNFSESKFTLLEDAMGYAYSMLGTDLGNDFEFLTKCGMGYRHVVGSFYWDLGYDVCWRYETSKQKSQFYAGIGVVL